MLHGSLSYLLQDADGQIVPAHSISAGLDYPGVGPEHSYLRDTGRVRYETATDAEALDAFQSLCRLEGIIPALEPAHALAWVRGRRGVVPGPDSSRVSQRTRRQGRRSRGPISWGGRCDAGKSPTQLSPASQVSELIQTIVKALRAFQMYLPNNPIYQRAIQNVRNALIPIWAATDELVLGVGETDMLWEEHSVYHQLNKSESVAWSL